MTTTAPAPGGSSTQRSGNHVPLAITVVTAIVAFATALLVFPSTVAVRADATGDPGLAAEVADLLPDGQSLGGSVGVAVAVLDHGRLRQAGLGTTDGSTPVRPGTVFETGSIQKVLTATLLADLLDTGQIALTDTLAALWPQIEFADPMVAAITVEQLATHTAGLPSFPVREDPGFARAMAGYLLGGDAYAVLGDPIESLARMTGHTAAPHEYSYSNLGYAALGRTLGAVAGTDYATALSDRVLRPLGMASTTIRTTEGVPAGAAHPYRTAAVPTVPWTNPDWEAVGTGTWSTTTDMISLLSSYLHPSDALRRTEIPYADGPYPGYGSATGLAWQLWNVDNTKFFWHNGLTNGSRTFMAHTDDDRAVVVMANSTDTPVEAIGFALLGQSIPEFAEAQIPHPILLVATLFLALGSTALVLVGMVRPRRGRLSRPLDRLKIVSLLIVGAALWLLSLRVGEWGFVPRTAWATGAALLAAAAVCGIRRWPHLPTARGRRGWLRWITFTPIAFAGVILLCAELTVIAAVP